MSMSQSPSRIFRKEDTLAVLPIQTQEFCGENPSAEENFPPAYQTSVSTHPETVQRGHEPAAIMNERCDEYVSKTPPDLVPNYSTRGEQEYRVYARRWFVLAVFACSSALNLLNYYSFAPVADLVGKYLNTSSAQVNWFAIVFLIILLPPIGLIGADLLDRFGLRFGLIALAVLQALGSLIRCLAVGSFETVI